MCNTYTDTRGSLVLLGWNLWQPMLQWCGREAPGPGVSPGRLTIQEVKAGLERCAGPGPAICFLCGPPDMVEQVTAWLQQLGVTQKNIKSELWW